jgi:hypothetical protein
MAALPGIADLHPLAPEETIQGLLELLFELQQMLGEISGLPAVSLQPAAGAPRRIGGADGRCGVFPAPQAAAHESARTGQRSRHEPRQRPDGRL